jgi:hypothetical protein
MKKYILLKVLFLFFIPSFSQEIFKEEFIEATRHMNSLEKYSVALKYKMYLDNNLQTPFQQKTVEINKDGNNLKVIHDGSSEMIQTTQMKVNVSHKLKSVYFAAIPEPDPAKLQTVIKNREKKSKDAYRILTENFDSLTRNITKIKLLRTVGNIKEYELEYSDGPYTKMRICLDIKNKVYKSITTHMREKSLIKILDKETERTVCMRVDYENYNEAPAFTTSTFSISKFVVKETSGKVVLNQNYKNYKLVVF